MEIADKSSGACKLIERYAYKRGVKLPILILYSFVIGFIFNLPLSVLLGEWKQWSRLRWRDIFGASICGIIWLMAQNLYVLSLALASTKLASIISTLVPAITFLLNVVFRKEKLSRSKACMAKVAGIVLMPIASVVFLVSEGSMGSKSSEWDVLVVGGLCVALSSPISTWFINQNLEMLCPEIAYSFTMVALMNLFGTLPAMIYAACLYQDMKYYSLEVDTKLRVLLFLSVLVSVATTAGARWCTQKKDASYVAAFSNFSQILDTVTAPLILNGKLQKESVVSFVIIIVGVRLFHWGNTEEAAAAAAATAERVKVDHPESEIQTAGVNTAAV